MAAHSETHIQDSSLAQFRQHCRERQINLTVQREVIFEAVMACGGHPTPEEIHAQVAKRHPSISLGTVYKNLKVFLDSGLFREAPSQQGPQRFEINPEPHHHLICSRCKAIFDYDPSNLDGPVLRGKLPRGFQVERMQVEIHGICGSCAKGGASKT